MQNSPDTIVSAGNLIEGKVEGSGIVQVLGTIRGDVVLQGTLLVDAGGLVDGTIEADHILVVGSILGRVHAREILEITGTAELSGTYSTNRLVVEQGAKINAAVTMSESSQGLPAATSKPASTVSTQTRPAPAARSSFFERQPEKTTTVSPAPITRPTPAAPVETPTPPPASVKVAPPAYTPPPEATFSDTAAVDIGSVAASMESTNAILERAQAALADTSSTATPKAEANSAPEPPPIPEPETAEEPSAEAADNAEAVPAKETKKKNVAKAESELEPEPAVDASMPNAKTEESMPLMFSGMLDEAEGDAHAGA